MLCHIFSPESEARALRPTERGLKGKSRELAETG
jgi:hypothetical protein